MKINRLNGVCGLALLFTALAASATAGDCFDYTKYPHLVSVGEIPKAYSLVGKVGDLALVGHPKGLSVVDISNPAEPLVLSRIDSLKITGSLAVSGNWALGAGAKGELVVVDLSQPHQPRRTKVVEPVKNAQDVVWEKDLACVRLKNGVQFWNMKTPDAPQWISSFWETHKPRDVLLSGGLAYIADQDAGVLVVDISNPELPVQIGRLKDFRNIAHIALVDTVLYAVVSPKNRQAKCHIISANVSDPRQPRLLDSLELPGHSAKDFLLRGKLAHILVYGGNLITVNIEDPSNFVGHGVMRTGYGEVLLDLGDQLGIMNRGDFSVAVFPGLSDEILPLATWTGSNESPRDNCFLVHDGYGYLVSMDGLLQVLDLNDPLNPFMVGELNGLPRPKKISITPEGLLVVWLSNDVPIFIDIGNPREPVQTDKAGGTILVGGRSGVRFTYVTELGFPVWVGEYQIRTPFNDVLVRDNLFYAVSNNRAFHIGSFEDPSAPLKVGMVENLPGIGRRIILEGPLAYVLTQSPPGLQIVDVSNPSEPTLRGRHLLPMMPEAAVVHDDKIYIHSIGRDVNIINVSDPDHPISIGAFKTKGSGGRLTIENSYLLHTGRKTLSVYPTQCN